MGWGYGLRITGNDLEHWNTHKIDGSNTVNGWMVNYYRNVSEIKDIPDGNLILANCSFLIIEGMSCQNRSFGIMMGFSHNVTITNGVFINNTIGIYAYRSEDCMISNNRLTFHHRSITLSNCHRIELLDNNLSHPLQHEYPYYGWAIGVSIFSSNNITLKDNAIVNFTGYGIEVLYSDNNNFRNNTLRDNNDAIELRDSDRNILKYNEVTENGEGIDIRGHGNILHFNNIHNNTYYGLKGPNEDGYFIDARYNWWGNATGPYHYDRNPFGGGDEVKNIVDISHWLNEPAYLGQGEEEDDGKSSFLLIVLLLILGFLFLLLADLILAPSGRRIVVDGKDGIRSSGGSGIGSGGVGCGKGTVTKKRRRKAPEMWKDGWKDGTVSGVRKTISRSKRTRRGTTKRYRCDACDLTIKKRGSDRAIRVPCPKCGGPMLNETFR